MNETQQVAVREITFQVAGPGFFRNGAPVTPVPFAASGDSSAVIFVLWALLTTLVTDVFGSPNQERYVAIVRIQPDGTLSDPTVPASGMLLRFIETQSLPGLAPDPKDLWPELLPSGSSASSPLPDVKPKDLVVSEYSKQGIVLEGSAQIYFWERCASKNRLTGETRVKIIGFGGL